MSPLSVLGLGSASAFKTLIAAALLSTIALASASAEQLPIWAIENPSTFAAEYPNRDVLNGGALTPAGRMGAEVAATAPVHRANSAYASVLHVKRKTHTARTSRSRN